MTQKKKASPLEWVRQFLVSLLLGANLVTLLFLWICCATTWVNPLFHPRIAFVGLAFPAFLIANLAFIALWLIYKPRMLVVPILGMALCGSYILDYCPLSLRSSSDVPELTVLTWNTCNLSLCQDDSLAFATDYLSHSEADLIFLQEHQYGAPKYHAMYDTLKARHFHITYHGSRTLVSRFPILNSDTLAVNTLLSNGIFRADLQYQSDTLTVFCVHLESNKLSPDDKSEYGKVIHAPKRDKVKSEVGYLAHKIGTASGYRANQVKALLQHIDSLPSGRSVLVCGDFNDTPISYTYQTVNRRLDNAFRARGRGIGISYNEKFFPVRIDHIFYSSDWQCTEACIDASITASDHYPVIAKLKKRQK